MTKSDAYMLFTISLNHFNQTTRKLEELDVIVSTAIKALGIPRAISKTLRVYRVYRIFQLA